MARSVVSCNAECGGGNVACRKYPFIWLKDKQVKEDVESKRGPKWKIVEAHEISLPISSS